MTTETYAEEMARRHAIQYAGWTVRKHNNAKQTETNIMNNLQVASVTLLDAVKRASAERASLIASTKRGVFSEYTRVCLGRVHNAKIQEQRKGWMIYDILRARYGQVIAEAAQAGRLNA